MKKFLITGLVTAIAAVGLISKASAASSDYCMNNRDDQRCSQSLGTDNPYPPIKDGNSYQAPAPSPAPPVYSDDNNNNPPRHRRYGDNGYPTRWNHRYNPDYNNYYDDNYYDNGYDQGAVFSFQFGNSGNACSDIGDSLSRSGFRRVRSVDCAGRDFAYVAYRDGQRLRIRVKASTGRIFSISRY